MKAKSIKGNSTGEIQAALTQSMLDGYKPTLAIVFISVKQDHQAICKLLDEIGIAVFGCTTNGEFIDEETQKGSVALLLLDINTDYFTIYFEAYPEKNYRDITNAIARKSKEKFSKPAFLIAGSNMETDAEQLLFGFEDIAGKEVNVYGCMAGDDFTFSEQFVFTNGQTSSCGLVCLALDEDKVMIKGVATCGWRAVGTVRTVTKSSGNHVYTVDDIPVLDITTKYSGVENVSPDNAGLLLKIAANFPLQLQRDQGDPVMRPGLVIDWSDRSFYCSGSVAEGSKVRFSLPPDFDVMVKEIIAQGGFIDKFIGDAVMAVFKGDFHLDRAIDASLAVRNKINALPHAPGNQSFSPQVSIGTNSGEMISGNIGSSSLRRLDYTVIGDAVNTAQRLQSVAGPGKILVNEAGYEKVKESFNCKRMGELTLKNKENPVILFEVMD